MYPHQPVCAVGSVQRGPGAGCGGCACLLSNRSGVVAGVGGVGGGDGDPPPARRGPALAAVAVAVGGHGLVLTLGGGSRGSAARDMGIDRFKIDS